MFCLGSTPVKEEEEEGKGEGEGGGGGGGGEEDVEMGIFHNLWKIMKLNAIPLNNYWGI